jgi:hypothetical protein
VVVFKARARSSTARDTPSCLMSVASGVSSI